MIIVIGRSFPQLAIVVAVFLFGGNRLRNVFILLLGMDLLGCVWIGGFMIKDVLF